LLSEAPEESSEEPARLSWPGESRHNAVGTDCSSYSVNSQSVHQSVSQSVSPSVSQSVSP